MPRNTVEQMQEFFSFTDPFVENRDVAPGEVATFGGLLATYSYGAETGTISIILDGTEVSSFTETVGSANSTGAETVSQTLLHSELIDSVGSGTFGVTLEGPGPDGGNSYDVGQITVQPGDAEASDAVSLDSGFMYVTSHTRGDVAGIDESYTIGADLSLSKDVGGGFYGLTVEVFRDGQSIGTTTVNYPDSAGPNHTVEIDGFTNPSPGSLGLEVGDLINFSARLDATGDEVFLGDISVSTGADDGTNGGDDGTNGGDDGTNGGDDGTNGGGGGQANIVVDSITAGTPTPFLVNGNEVIDIAITNTGSAEGGATFQATATGALSDSIELTVGGLDPGETRVLTWDVIPGSTGTTTVEVGGVSRTFTVDFSGFDASLVTIDDCGLERGVVSQGENQRAEITVSNDNGTAAQFDIEVSEGGSVVATLDGQAILAEDTMTYTVLYTPGGTGTRSPTVSLVNIQEEAPDILL